MCFCIAIMEEQLTTYTKVSSIDVDEHYTILVIPNTIISILYSLKSLFRSVARSNLQRSRYFNQFNVVYASNDADLTRWGGTLIYKATLLFT